MSRRKKTENTVTPLGDFIRGLLEKGHTLRELGKIAGGVSVSVIHGWETGRMPSENMRGLQVLANHFNRSLASVLTGQPDTVMPEDAFERVPFYEGLMEVRLTKLVPKKKS